MNEAHLHLAINHFPIILPLVGLILLIAGGILKSSILQRTAFIFYIMAALLTVAAYSSGEAAEHFIEDLPGVEEKYMQMHEEAAETFSWIMYVLGGFSLVGIWVHLQQKSFRRWIDYLTIILTIVVLFFAKETGTTGGEIMHAEIRTGASETVNTIHNDEGHNEYPDGD